MSGITDRCAKIHLKFRPIWPKFWMVRIRDMQNLCTQPTRQQTLSVIRGDSVAVVIRSEVDLSLIANAIFTAKSRIENPDSEAKIQKQMGTGLEIVSGNSLTLDFVPADTDWCLSQTQLYWDVQVQAASGAVATVATGILKIFPDVTRETTISVPVHTTNPPIPAGGLTPHIHAQPIESAEWIINHNRGYYPIVQVSNALHERINAHIWDYSENQVRISFSKPFSGSARLI